MQRRLLVLLLAAAALVWAVTLTGSFLHARHEINELFDTQLIRLARQVRATLPADASAGLPGAASDLPTPRHEGEANLNDMSVGVWNRDGQLVLADKEGVVLPPPPAGDGFADLELRGHAWRVYYLGSGSGTWLIGVGQRVEERNELIRDLVLSQLSLWVLALPVLLGAILVSVRHALRPLRALAAEVEQRSPDELKALPEAPSRELRPLVRAMNRLFGRVGDAIEHERRLTADAAHELRTPIAALQAQVEVAQLAQTEAGRRTALAALTSGIARLSGLVGQLLALARLENLETLSAPKEVRWDRVMEQVLSDCLPQADRRGSEIDCTWPAAGAAAFPLQGDEGLLAVMLRNLVENAVRYARDGAHVQIAFEADRLRVEDDGPGVSDEALGRLGDRFYRPPGHEQSGSGLGLSIVGRIAQLHGLAVQIGNRAGGGLQVVVTRAAPAT
jgi:two-component system, OmpR family, sensor histidine kinase QseC